MAQKHNEQQKVYPVAFEGAMTRDGGKVVVAQGKERPTVSCLPVALVGDEVHYPDGRMARIDSGAGFGAQFNGTPFALVGSSLDNDDVIVSTPVDQVCVVEAEGVKIQGLFDRNYLSARE